MSWADDLVGFITSFDPDFKNEIRGASQEEILEFCELIKAPIPQVYADYLTVMGHSDGGLFLAQRTYTSLAELRDYYLDLFEDFPGIKFKRCIPFAVGDVYEGLGLLVEQDLENPPVVFLEDGQPGDLFSQGLPIMAFQAAFIFESAAQGRTIRYVSFPPDASRGDLIQGIQAQGFSELWMSDENLYCARNEDVSLTLHRGGPGGSFALCVGGSDERSARLIGDEISNNLGGVFEKWYREKTLPEQRSGNG